MLYTSDAISKRVKKAKKIKSIIVTAIYILLIPLLIYNISLIFQSVINPNKTPSFFGYKTYVIISGSMVPELEIGDIVIVKENEKLQKGDIISFRQGQNIITHRITEIIETNGYLEYKTKGDSNNAEDSGTINNKIIEGKVVSKIPNVGKITIFLQNKMVIISITLIFFIYVWHDNKIKQKKEERRIKRLEYEKKKKIGKGN